MANINFKQAFAACKTESECKTLWAELLTASVKAQNERIMQLSVPEAAASVNEDKKENKAETKGASKTKTAPKPEKAEAKAETKPEKKEYKGIEAVKLTADEKRAVKAAGLKYVDYSERSFAITGDTKPVKDILKKLSGKPNRNLSCGFGWVFAKVNEQAVLTSLNLKK